MVTSGDYRRSYRARFSLARRNAKVATTNATKRIRVPFVAFCNYRGPFLYPIGVKVGLAFFFLAFPARGDPLRLYMPSLFLHNPLIGIITGKYEMMARKRQKSRCSNDGDFRLRGRRFWRDENDGDSVLKTESWQVNRMSVPQSVRGYETDFRFRNPYVQRTECRFLSSGATELSVLY